MNSSKNSDLMSFQQLVQHYIAQFSSLPIWQQKNIQNSLERGTAICQNKDQLIAYMALFGNLHHAKLSSLFDFLLETNQFNDQAFSVIDYGCGQGIGSFVLHERRVHHGLCNTIDELVLIEPSTIALQQAVSNNQSRYNTIRTVAKPFSELNSEDVRTRHDITVHIFSNVLDMQHINTYRLARTIQHNRRGVHVFVCCSPNYYSGNQSIKTFAAAFAPKQIFTTQEGCLANIFSVSRQQTESKVATRYACIFQHAA